MKDPSRRKYKKYNKKVANNRISIPVKECIKKVSVHIGTYTCMAINTVLKLVTAIELKAEDRIPIKINKTKGNKIIGNIYQNQFFIRIYILFMSTKIATAWSIGQYYQQYE